MTTETSKNGSPKTYRVTIDPQYHVFIHPASNGIAWSDARAEAIGLIQAFLKEGIREHWHLMLCQYCLERTSEATYADDLTQYKAELDNAAKAEYDRSLSPESLSDGMWARRCSSFGETVLEYFEDLRRNNGRIDTPPNDAVIWGLRSIDSGRWVCNADKYGVTSFQIFRTRALAERFQMRSDVVWMHPRDWWKKVEDAAKTGYPTQVIVLADLVNGTTDERIYRVDDLVTGGPDEFIAHINS